MKRDGPLYTFAFAAAVCFVCSALVCSANVLLKSRQEINKKLDKQSQVLAVAGLLPEGERLSADEIVDLFNKTISPRLVRIETGQMVPEGEAPDAADYDQRKARDDKETSIPAPPNAAGIGRIPKLALVYVVRKDGKMESLILPIEGPGLWSTLYGFLALDKDLRTIHGITFYEQGETAGLGGEVDNPRWKALWKGRLAFDEKGEPRIQVKKGIAGSVSEDPYHVDGLSGATITSNAVSHMLTFWLGESGFGKLLKKLSAERM